MAPPRCAAVIPTQVCFNSVHHCNIFLVICEEKSTSIKPMKRVLVIQTGGTILMQTDKRFAGTVTPDPELAKGYLLREIPELKRIADIHVIELFYEDSSNLNPEYWVTLSETIYRNYNDFDGFVILHGTDTMAFSASALSYTLRPLSKPVIFTGSQVPLANLRSDARRNLINSVEIATMKVSEVAICFNDRLYRGNRTTKMSIGDFDAFSSPNFEPLAEIGLNIDIRQHFHQPADADSANTLNFKSFINPVEFGNTAIFDDKVYVLKLFPGLNPKLLYPLLDSGLRGLLIEGFGSGNFPVKGDYALTDFLKACASKDIVITMCSQAPFDAIDLSKYESGRTALELGIISSKTMTIEASVTKLMYLLAHNNNPQSVRDLYTVSLAGEI